MIRLITLVITLVVMPTAIGQVATGQVRHAPDLELDRLFETARTLAETADSESVWVGYSIGRQMYANSHFGWYGGGSGGRVLSEVLAGKPHAASEDIVDAARRALATLEAEGEDSDEEEPLIEKDVAILFRLQRSGEVSEMRLATLDAPARLGTAPILWGGRRPARESLAFLESQLTALPDDLEEEVVAAIGAHDLPKLVLPVLVEIASQRGDQDAGEAARHWLADHLAVTMGLRPQIRQPRSSGDEVRRSALYALINAEEGSAPDLLVRLIASSPDTEIRRLALIQLAHLDDRAGESALLGMAERYLRSGG